MGELVAIACVFLTFSLLSHGLEKPVLTAPILFLAAGMRWGSRLIRLVDLGQVAPCSDAESSLNDGITTRFDADAPEIGPVVRTPFHLGWSRLAERTEVQISATEARSRKPYRESRRRRFSVMRGWLKPSSAGPGAVPHQRLV
jgi:hypothetical protein